MSHILTEQASGINVALRQFYRDVLPTSGYYCLTLLPEGRHLWVNSLEELERSTEAHANRRGLYFGTAAFSTTESRKQSNVRALRALRLDIDAGPEKLAKHGEACVYPTQRDAAVATVLFAKTHQLLPTYLASSGAGLHVYYCLTDDLHPAEWQPLAEALAALCGEHGLKVDRTVTTDTARILRPLGSLHHSGNRVELLVNRGPIHDPAELRLKLRVTDSTPIYAATASSINAEVLEVAGGTLPVFDYLKAAKSCAAMRQAADRNGAETPYPVWLLALATAKNAVGGVQLAHELSRGHATYDEAATARKLESLTGGPANCTAWAEAYGAGGPCDACAYRGKIKNPAVQLGAVPDATPPGELAANGNVPDWVAEMNKRHAVVRVGASVAVADFQSPHVSELGVRASLGFLEVGAFRTLLRGRVVHGDQPGDKPRALADAWMSHLGRRQYEMMLFAPGAPVPANVLNLWQGFAVEAVEGDVAPWLAALRALVQQDADREYILKWLAWKVQNPGGVPDTIPILTGAKGTGKNSLFEPVLAMFGPHGLLADNPELIAGRFTGHLMRVAFAVLDEAVFTGDPRQADAIKSRVTAKTMTYEQKGMDPIPGVNHCAFVMLTNHSHVWQATADERRAVVIEAGEALRGDLAFWRTYHAWLQQGGAAALLAYLLTVDVSMFNPRAIPKGEALRRQVEMTALRDPVAAWWFRVLAEGEVRHQNGTVLLNDTQPTQINRAVLRESFEQSASARGRAVNWATAARKVTSWAGEVGVGKVRTREGDGTRNWHDVLPPLPELRRAFTLATQIVFDD